MHHRFTYEFRNVPPRRLRDIDPKAVVLSSNYSEDRAPLTSPGTLSNFTVALLFSGARVDALHDASNAKRARNGERLTSPTSPS